MRKHLQPAEKRKAVSYRFGEKLGSGAFGTVYKAFDESNNVFAIKVLDAHGFKFPGGGIRFHPFYSNGGGGGVKEGLMVSKGVLFYCCFFFNSTRIIGSM